MNKNNFDRIVDVCSGLLYDSSAATTALDYLNNRLDTNTQRKFCFGYFPPQEQLSLLLSLVDVNDLFITDLAYEEHREIDSGHKIIVSNFSHHNLVMPYRDVYGNIVALVGRSLLNDDERLPNNISKYKNTIFKKSRHLFGLFEAKISILEKQSVYIVEGQFDVIKAHSKGITNIVALGSSNMSMEQLILLLRYTNNIKLLLDNDEAGTIGRDRIIEKYGKYTNISQKYLPDGFKDLDEFLGEIEINDSFEFEHLLVS